MRASWWRHAPSPRRKRATHLDITKIEHHDAYVRTTLTLDEDLAKELKEEVRRSGRSFKEVVNAALRKSLSTGDKPPSPRSEFVVEARPCGFRRGVDPLKLNQLSDELEIADFEAGLARDLERR